MKRRFSLILCCLLVLVLVTSQLQVFGAKTIRLGLALEHLGNPFYATLKTAAEKEAKVQGVELTALGVSFSTDIESEVRIIEDFTAKKVDLIGYAAVDIKGVVASLEKAKKSGIPIISVDTKADWTGDTTVISTDNVMGGYYAGLWLANALNGDGKIAVIEGKSSSTNVARLKGFNKALEMYPDIKIAVKVPADFRRDLGLTVTQDVLTGYPDIEGIFFLNDEMALGGLQALKAHKLEKKILSIGYNGAAEALGEVAKGNLHADVVQFPELMGKLFVDTAIKVLDGKKVPTFINSGVCVIDSSTVDKVRAILAK